MGSFALLKKEVLFPTMYLHSLKAWQLKSMCTKTGINRKSQAKSNWLWLYCNMIIDRTQEICRSRINKDAGHIIRWLRKVFSLQFQYYYTCLWLCNLLLPIALVSTQESLLCSVFFYLVQLCWSTQKLVIPFFGSYFCWLVPEKSSVEPNDVFKKC